MYRLGLVDTLVTHANTSAIYSGGAGEHPGIWGLRKGVKPDFCLLEFSYYYEHPWIQKAIYGAEH